MENDQPQPGNQAPSAQTGSENVANTPPSAPMPGPANELQGSQAQPTPALTTAPEPTPDVAPPQPAAQIPQVEQPPAQPSVDVPPTTAPAAPVDTPVDTPAVQQTVVTGGVTPPTAPTGGPKNKKTLFITAIVVAVIVVLGGAAFAFTKMYKSGGGVVADCTPPNSQELTKEGAVSEFKTLAQAIMKKDQACVDKLSSSFFKKYQARVFSGPNWITKSALNLPSTSDSFAKIPDFNDANFTKEDYVRPRVVVADSTATTSAEDQPKGLTLGYVMNDAATDRKIDVRVSFISSQNKILVDEFKLAPPGFYDHKNDSFDN